MQYGENLLSYNEITDDDKEKYKLFFSDVYNKISDILEKSIHPKSLRAKYPDKTLTELKSYIEKLLENYQRILYLKFGEDLDKYYFWPYEETNKTYVNNTYQRAMNKLAVIIKEPLYEFDPKSLRAKYPNNTMEELKHYINKLPKDYQRILYLRHGQELDQYYYFQCDESQRPTLYNLYQRAIKRLDENINRSAFEFNSKSLRVKYSHINIEDLKFCISKMPKDYQKVLYLRHGEELGDFYLFPKNETNKVFLYNLYQRAINKLDQEIDIFLNRMHPKSIRAKYPHLSFEELEKYIKQLTLKQQEAIYLVNGKNLNDYKSNTKITSIYYCAKCSLDK